MFLRLQSGEPMIRRAVLPAAGTPTQPPINQGSANVRVERRGNSVNPYTVERLDPVAILDLRAEKQFGLGRYGVLHIYADLFNVFNTNTVTAIEVDSSTNYDNIFSLVSPRVFRIGVGYDF